METLNTVDRMKLSGFFLLIIATRGSIVIMPIIGNKIDKLDKAIAEFRDYRILTGLCKLDNEAHLTRRKINLFEANQVIYIHELEKYITGLLEKDTNQTIKLEDRVHDLRQKVLDQTVGLAEWTNIGDKKNTVKEIFAICEKNSTVEEKIEKVEKIFDANRAIESGKLEKKHKERDKSQAVKESLEGWKSLWGALFIISQVGGLILFTGADVIYKFIKRLSMAIKNIKFK